MGRKTNKVFQNLLLLMICLIAVLALVFPANCSPYFALDTEARWNDALAGGNIIPMTSPEWSNYMSQWSMFLMEGDPYPTNTFLPPELYVYGGGGGGGLDPEEPGLVMAWGSSTMNPGSYSSAWKYDYLLDPNLTNAVVNVTVIPPQFNPAGNQINTISFGIRDVAGNIRSWQWGVGPGKPIPWNIPTQVTIVPAIMGIGATVPIASGFANNPAFNIVNSQFFIADENARWVGGQSLIPPPGQVIPRIWNYWSNTTVTPNGAQLDYGDAPDLPYPTVLARNGARHIISPNMFLGFTIDSEPNGQPHPAALGDDIANLPDEDGVVFTSPITPGLMTTLNVTASVPGMLDAWIDFNGDGSWAQPGDQIFMNMPLMGGINLLSFMTPASATPGVTTFARFRYSSAGNQSYIGLAMDGEVEDYQVSISQHEEQYDWGDAPDLPYPTLSASNGANHLIRLGMFLGNTIDAEPDGQPDPNALGDDNNGVPNDEDGVTFNTPILPGGNATVTVVASMPGMLDAWIDFGKDGNWATPGDQIAFSAPLVAGANAITFPVPIGTASGIKTFARFRYSSLGGLPFTGSASDGEVEDYQVDIGYKWIQPPDLSTLGIDVNASHPFILADDFLCTTTGPITDIHVWGSWLNDILPGDAQNVKFTLSIHKDVPAGPQTPSHPGEVLWYRTFQPGQFTAFPYSTDIDEGWMDPPALYLFPGDHVCWEYDFTILENPFIQRGTEQEPIVYWLDVQAEPLGAADARFGWKTSVKHWNDDATWGQGAEPYPGPWNELRYPPQHELQGQSMDLAFAITGKIASAPGNLLINYCRIINDHFWWPTPDPYNEMINLVVAADPTENITWNSIDLAAYGIGNDAADISAVNVWLDNNNDGSVGLTDTLIGTGAYPADNSTLVINLTSPQLILAGTSKNVLISYTMSPTAAVGSTYQFDVTGAAGIGMTSGLPVGVIIAPSPMSSAKKIVGLKPITIGEAKKLPIGAPFLLMNKEITADFLPPTKPYPWNWFYIEEPTRASGIAVIGGLTGPLNIGDLVAVRGSTTLVNGAELMVIPNDIIVTSHTQTITPLGMNNKWTGGGIFGGQPAVVDKAWDTPSVFSVGLNNVGSLIRTWGMVTGYGGVYLDGVNLVDVFWMDDGSNLADGYTTTAGDNSIGIAVVTPTGTPTPPAGYWGVTGILRAVANPSGVPMRLLVPRDYTIDMTNYPLPPAR